MRSVRRGVSRSLCGSRDRQPQPLASDYRHRLLAVLIAGGLFLVWKATKEIHHTMDTEHAPAINAHASSTPPAGSPTTTATSPRATAHASSRPRPRPRPRRQRARVVVGRVYHRSRSRRMLGRVLRRGFIDVDPRLQGIHAALSGLGVDINEVSAASAQALCGLPQQLSYFGLANVLTALVAMSKRNRGMSVRSLP